MNICKSYGKKINGTFLCLTISVYVIRHTTICHTVCKAMCTHVQNRQTRRQITTVCDGEPHTAAVE